MLWPALGGHAGDTGVAIPSPLAPTCCSQWLPSDPQNPPFAAFQAAGIHGVELARELHPASVLPWANGPAWCLARVRSVGQFSVYSWEEAEGGTETFRRKAGLWKLLEKSPLGSAGGQWF